MSPPPNLLRAMVLGLFLTLTFLVVWELHWRSKGYVPSIEDDGALWARNRDRVDRLGAEDVVILGSSRAHFGIMLDTWEETTGRKPVQLAGDGRSPVPFFQDIAENSDFKGLIVLSVAPELFYSTEENWSEKRAKEWLDFREKETYAQKFNYWADKFADQRLAYLSSDGDYYNSLPIKTLIGRIPLADRDSVPPPYMFPFFGTTDLDRNRRLIERVETDTSYRNMIRDVWEGDGWDTLAVDKQIDLPAFFGRLKIWTDQIKARGGRVALIRPPSSGKYLENEILNWPREKYWDPMLAHLDCPGFFFSDNPLTANLHTPEWSHLTHADAITYTQEVIRFLQSNNLIPPPQN
ncbi:MAG: hypothetical protein IPJ00_19425 [Saprospirales bacterium]|nr:hypothetical protein [Saprospirales bacterium]